MGQDNSTEERIEALEARILSLEADRDRLLHSLKQAVGMALQNPMLRMAMPKNIIADLERMNLGGQTKGTQKQ